MRAIVSIVFKPDSVLTSVKTRGVSPDPVVIRKSDAAARACLGASWRDAESEPAALAHASHERMAQVLGIAADRLAPDPCSDPGCRFRVNASETRMSEQIGRAHV